MFSEGIRQSNQNLLTYPLVLQTLDADEAASFLASSAVPYRSDLISPNFSTEVSGPESPRMYLSRVKTTGAMQVHSESPGDSYAIVLAVLVELEHRVSSEIVPVRPGMGFVQSPNQPVTVRTPERFELIFLRRSRENVIQELEKMLVREISTNLIFSPCFNMRTEAGRRFRRLVLSLCAHLGEQDSNENVYGGDEQPRKRRGAHWLNCASDRKRPGHTLARSPASQLYPAARPPSRRRALEGSRCRRVYDRKCAPAFVGRHLYGRRREFTNVATQLPAQRRGTLPCSSCERFAWNACTPIFRRKARSPTLPRSRRAGDFSTSAASQPSTRRDSEKNRLQPGCAPGGNADACASRQRGFGRAPNLS